MVLPLLRKSKRTSATGVLASPCRIRRERRSNDGSSIVPDRDDVAVEGASTGIEANSERVAPSFARLTRRGRN
jgi:hypothetical protein